MPKLSDRGKAMPASPIRKLVPYAEEARRKGKKVYQLNIGQPDIDTPEIALNAIKNLDKTVLEYSHSAGYESYRRKLAGSYRKIGLNIDYTDIIVTTGGSEAILFTLLSCLEPGDEVIIPEPFYANYNGFAIAAGVKIVPVTSRIENDFALPPVVELEKKISPRTRAIIICNPNNPTGYLYTEAELDQLKGIVKKHDLFLMADEVYREFCYGGNRHKSVLELDGIEQNTIMFDSVSKRYSACGVRVGAIVTKNRDIINTALKFAQARLSPPGLGQIVAEAALETPESYFEDVNQEYLERRDLLVEGLNKIEGVYCPKPNGAFYTTVKLPVDDAETFAQWILTDFEHENQTVMVAPAAGFYSTPGLGKNEVRIAYVLKKEDLVNAIECLKIALEAYPGRKLD